MNQWDIVWVSFPYSDLSGKKIRPSLIVSNNSYNSGGNDIIICALTSNLGHPEHKIAISQDDLISGTLAVPSAVKADKIMQASKKLVLKKFAELGPEKFSETIRKINIVISPEACMENIWPAK